MVDGFIYAIDGGNGVVKIGSSSNPERRLIGLQTGWPTPLTLAFSLKSPTPAAVERRAHKMLAPHRTGGEWFRVGVEDAIRAITAAASPPARAVTETSEDNATAGGVLNRHKRMQPDEYHEAITKLGFNVEDAGRFLGVSGRASRRWLDGERSVPPPVAKLLRMMIHLEIHPDSVP